MENLGYYNGEYDLIENMEIPMDDRVLAMDVMMQLVLEITRYIL